MFIWQSMNEDCEVRKSFSAAFCLYDRALALYHSNEQVQALAVLDEVQMLTPEWLRPLLLRAYILRTMSCPVQEMNVLQD